MSPSQLSQKDLINVSKDTEPTVYTSKKVLLQQSATSFAQTTLRHTYKPLTHCDENSCVNITSVITNS